MQQSPDSATFRGYLLFWTGQLVSLLGSSIVQFAIIWYITVLTQSPLMLAIASLLGLGTQVILTPIAGVFTDRLNRKYILALVDMGQALMTLILILLFWLNIASLIHILALLMLRGMFQAFHSPTVSAIAPTMIPKEQLSRMNSVDYLFNGVIYLTGPVVGALLLSFWELPQLLWIDVVTFFIPLIPLLLITIPSVKQPETDVVKPSFMTDFREGLQFMYSTRGLIPLLLLSASLNFLLMPLGTLLPYFINVVHAGTVEQLALIMAVSQGGTIAASILMITKKTFNRRDYLIAGAVYGVFVGYMIIALAPISDFYIIAIGMLIIGLAAPIANITLRTIFQTIVPHDKLGRVIAVLSTVSMAMSPLGILYSGIMAEFIGVIILYFSSAILGILILTIVLMTTSIREVIMLTTPNLPIAEVEQKDEKLIT